MRVHISGDARFFPEAEPMHSIAVRLGSPENAF
jgi:hypothetical protein